MIWFIIWMLIGFAGGIHALFVIRRDIDKDYPWYDLKSDPLIENLDDVMIILISVMIGPLSFLVTAYTFPRSFFK
jgi:hypothetical protein